MKQLMLKREHQNRPLCNLRDDFLQDSRKRSCHAHLDNIEELLTKKSMECQRCICHLRYLFHPNLMTRNYSHEKEGQFPSQILSAISFDVKKQEPKSFPRNPHEPNSIPSNFKTKHRKQDACTFKHKKCNIIFLVQKQSLNRVVSRLKFK